MHLPILYIYILVLVRDLSTYRTCPPPPHFPWEYFGVATVYKVKAIMENNAIFKLTFDFQLVSVYTYIPIVTIFIFFRRSDRVGIFDKECIQNTSIWNSWFQWFIVDSAGSRTKINSSTRSHLLSSFPLGRVYLDGGILSGKTGKNEQSRTK